LSLALHCGSDCLCATTNIILDEGVDNSGTVMFHGAPANVDAALNGLSYRGKGCFNGPRERSAAGQPLPRQKTALSYG
jgi:hypothetical protein